MIQRYYVFNVDTPPDETEMPEVWTAGVQDCVDGSWEFIAILPQLFPSRDEALAYADKKAGELSVTWDTLPADIEEDT